MAGFDLRRHTRRQTDARTPTDTDRGRQADTRTHPASSPHTGTQTQADRQTGGRTDGQTQADRQADGETHLAAVPFLQRLHLLLVDEEGAREQRGGVGLRDGPEGAGVELMGCWLLGGVVGLGLVGIAFV